MGGRHIVGRPFGSKRHPADCRLIRAERDSPGIGKPRIQPRYAVRSIREVIIKPAVILSYPFRCRLCHPQAAVIVDTVKGLLRLFIDHVKPAAIGFQSGGVRRVSRTRPASSSHLNVRTAGQLNRVIRIGFVIYNVVHQNPFLIQTGVDLHLYFNPQVVKRLHSAVG